ncbi:molecular chaperone TorD family protein [Pseudaminobacter sp. 19-2017]|uniref:Molecular chaperone TorD family protein n=1 Tax=Pseudaminobacter soli (ex Zhang et al. 2022) TaxID=2831468 RepID=A0A942DZ74_9HYPH|nr:molecular chaperone TorD family protein [Pseudaminobacter soli]MBS3647640.1 molecular chaperone TorD family protein [Pseudaminobacter soli]
MNSDLPLDQAHGSSDGADASIFGAGAADLIDLDQARADEYALLASLLLTPPDADFLARLAFLQDSSDTPLGRAHAALGQAAGSASADAVGREYSDLFIGVARGELLPYASYYLTGFLNERPLARLRGDMMRLGIECADGHSDPEDHLGTLCEMMSGFAGKHFVVPAGEEQDFFERHVAPWAGRFFADLESATAAKFYRAVGTVGRLFIEIENEAFAMETRRSA